MPNQSESEQNRGIADMYSRRDFDKGPATYTNKEFAQKIYEATGIEFSQGPIMMLDIMSGPGMLSSSLKEFLPEDNNVRFTYLDLAAGSLQKISTGEDRIQGDARAIPLIDESVDVVTARYSLKDLPEDEQKQAISEIFRILKPGGVLVVADMVALHGTKEWLNSQHSMKQQFGGRNAEEGECNILEEGEWFGLLEEQGFSAQYAGEHISHVDTKNWLDSNQITAEQQTLLNKFILQASDETREIYNIREDEGVKIDYPVIILQAKKPIVQ